MCTVVMRGKRHQPLVTIELALRDIKTRRSIPICQRTSAVRLALKACEEKWRANERCIVGSNDRKQDRTDVNACVV